MTLRSRVFTILHLSLIFSLLLLQVGRPFVEEFYHHQREVNLLNALIGYDAAHEGQSAVVLPAEQQAILKKNRNFYNQLPRATQAEIRDRLEKLNTIPPRSLLQIVREGSHTLFFRTTPLMHAWFFISFLACMLLLFQIEGARTFGWILPVLACAATLSTLSTAAQPPSTEERLWPTEEEIITNHLGQPFSSDIGKQQQQLIEGWHHYLVTVWTSESPSYNREQFAQQVEAGHYQFNIARAQALAIDSAKGDRGSSSSFFGNLLFILWNVVFAAAIWWDDRAS